MKKTLLTAALIVSLTIPAISSAMTADQYKNSLGTVIHLLDIAQSLIKNTAFKNAEVQSLTSSTVVSYDANSDGQVNFEDLNQINTANNDGRYSTSSDLNNDGSINNADFFALRNYFKQNGDYVNAYDMDNLGAGWVTVPANGVINQGDVSALKFAAAVYKSDNSLYSPFPDLNQDGSIDGDDVSVLEDYIASQEEEEEEVETVVSNPPSVLQSYPEGELDSSKEESYIIVVTNEPAYCSYSLQSVGYDAMTPFTFTASGKDKNGHAQLITGLDSGDKVDVYVKCKNFNGDVMEDDYVLSFSIGGSSEVTPTNSDVVDLDWDMKQSSVIIEADESGTSYKITTTDDYWLAGSFMAMNNNADPMQKSQVWFSKTPFGEALDQMTPTIIGTQYNACDNNQPYASIITFSQGVYRDAACYLDTNETYYLNITKEGCEGDECSFRQTLRGGPFRGLDTDLVDTDTSVFEKDSGEQEGTFVIEFEATVNDTDLYFNPGAEQGDTHQNYADGKAISSQGAEYVILDDNGDAVTKGVASAAFASTADVEDSRYVMMDGETETFTLSVDFVPTTSGAYKMRLLNLNVSIENSDPTFSVHPFNLAEFETDLVILNAN